VENVTKPKKGFGKVLYLNKNCEHIRINKMYNSLKHLHVSVLTKNLNL